VRALDAASSERLVARIQEAMKKRDTLGGVVEVVVTGIPVGLGSHVQWDRKLDGRLAQALASIPAIKAVEVGNGWLGAARQSVANRDLWQRLIDQTRRHDVVWHKVKGHSGDALNERVDALARGAIAMLVSQ